MDTMSVVTGSSGCTNNATFQLSDVSRDDLTDPIAEAVFNFISLYITPFILGPGLIGNTLSMLVMQRPRYATSSTWVYLRFLAFWDNMFIIFYGIQGYISKFVPLQMLWGSFFCKEYYYFAGASNSSYYGVLFMTVDRFCAVHWPLRAATLCTKKKAKITCVCISFLMMLAFSPQLTREMLTDASLADRDRCPTKPRWLEEPMYIFLTIFIMMASPILVFIFNILILSAIRRNRKERSEMTGSQQKGNSKETNMDALLLAVSWAFCACLFPFTLDYFTFNYIAKPVTSNQVMVRKLCYEFVRLLILTNSSINFYLYCLSSSKFRLDLLEIFKGNIGRKETANSCNVSSARLKQ
ncbi:galanin receptor 2b-like [Lineus longissimus]|uniref:galanin receptor 2b-like n=1 Tax=Lineus longissimus TaxID=88925 RepID=UPI00315DA4DE